VAEANAMHVLDLLFDPRNEVYAIQSSKIANLMRIDRVVIGLHSVNPSYVAYVDHSCYRPRTH